MRRDESTRRAPIQGAKPETATSGQRRIQLPRSGAEPPTDTPTERYGVVGAPVELLEEEPTRVGVVRLTAEAHRSDRPPPVLPDAEVREPQKKPRVVSSSATQRFGAVATPIEVPIEGPIDAPIAPSPPPPVAQSRQRAEMRVLDAREIEPQSSSRATEIELTAVDASESRRQPTIRTRSVASALPAWVIWMAAIAIGLSVLAAALAVR